jgi:hypothetical protein
MKTKLAIALSMIAIASVGAVSNASAQELTRADVTLELVQAENNGLRFVTDTSYPDVNPGFTQQVARLKQSKSGEGPMTSGSSAAGTRSTTNSKDMASCVGPAGFCTPYFGS